MGDSRVEMNLQVKDFFLDTFGDGTRYLYSGTTDDLIDLPDSTDDQPISPQPESLLQYLFQVIHYQALSIRLPSSRCDITTNVFT